MSALNIISVLNVDRVPPPYSISTGGTSKGDPGLGSGDDSTRLPIFDQSDITTADKAGAAILTILVVVMWCGGGWWMIK